MFAPALRAGGGGERHASREMAARVVVVVVVVMGGGGGAPREVARTQVTHAHAGHARARSTAVGARPNIEGTLGVAARATRPRS